MYVVLVSCDYHAAVHAHRVFRSHRISSSLENGFKLLTESTPVGIEIENNNVSRCCIVMIEREEREEREGREETEEREEREEREGREETEGREEREERRKGRGGREEGRINTGSEIAHLGSHPWLRAVFNKILQHIHVHVQTQPSTECMHRCYTWQSIYSACMSTCRYCTVVYRRFIDTYCGKFLIFPALCSSQLKPHCRPGTEASLYTCISIKFVWPHIV